MREYQPSDHSVSGTRASPHVVAVYSSTTAHFISATRAFTQRDVHALIHHATTRVETFWETAA